MLCHDSSWENDVNEANIHRMEGITNMDRSRVQSKYQYSYLLRRTTGYICSYSPRPKFPQNTGPQAQRVVLNVFEKYCAAGSRVQPAQSNPSGNVPNFSRVDMFADMSHVLGFSGDGNNS